MVDYLEEGCTINDAYYTELRRLHQAIVNKRRGKLTRGVLLLQDNASANTSLVAMAAATKCSLEVLPHPPYSSDLGPSDLCLFPYMNINLRSRNSGSNEGDIYAVDEFLEDQEKRASILKR